MTFDLNRILQIAQLYPERVRVYPLGACDEQGRSNLQGMARQNEKRDAYVKLSVEDEWIKGLQDDDESKRPLVFTICIPRELVDCATADLVLPSLERKGGGSLYLPPGVGA